jgi:hypothetical protein
MGEWLNQGFILKVSVPPDAPAEVKQVIEMLPDNLLGFDVFAEDA